MQRSPCLLAVGVQVIDHFVVDSTDELRHEVLVTLQVGDDTAGSMPVCPASCIALSTYDASLSHLMGKWPISMHAHKKPVAASEQVYTT